jgi:hypothetical protein
MFDFSTPSLNTIFSEECYRHWHNQLTNISGASPLSIRPKWDKILIGFSPIHLEKKVISYYEAKSRIPEFAHMLPHVEVCYPGDLPLSISTQCIVYKSNNTHDFRVFSGGIVGNHELFEMTDE